MTDNADWTVVRSVVTKDTAVPSDAIDSLGKQRVFALLTAGTMIAAERKFGHPGDPRAIAAFVKDLKNRFADRAADVKPMAAEAVIRASLGEPELMDEIDLDTTMSMMILVTYAIITEFNLGPADTEAYCREVVALADELQASS